MTKVQIVIAVLAAYKLLLILVGYWASKRTKDTDDFFLGGRQLGPIVAAISYSSSASSAWTLLGVSGFAYVNGLSTIWVVAGSVTGMLVAWYWIAPRLMCYSREHNHITLTDFLAHDSAGSQRQAIVWAASVIIIISFVFYVAAQFQGAGNTFASTFALPMNESIILGAFIIMVYTMMGGFWAVSVTDTIQGSLMALTAIVLPVAALLQVGGIMGFLHGLKQVSSVAKLSLTAGNTGLFAVGILLGGLSIGIGTYGQPHLLVRFMALRDEKAMRQARLITIFWYLLVFLGMYFVGLVGHLFHYTLENPETIFFVLTDSLFSPVVSAIVFAAVLSAIMSTADSQLLVAASTIAHDLGLAKRNPQSMLLVSRLTIMGLVIASVLVAIYMPAKIFSRVLFAWIALGSAFGPIVFLRLAGASLKPAVTFVSIIIGFSLAVILSFMPDTLGTWLERLAPFVVAFFVLYCFGRQQKIAIA